MFHVAVLRSAFSLPNFWSLAFESNTLHPGACYYSFQACGLIFPLRLSILMRISLGPGQFRVQVQSAEFRVPNQRRSPIPIAEGTLYISPTFKCLTSHLAKTSFHLYAFGVIAKEKAPIGSPDALSVPFYLLLPFSFLNWVYFHTYPAEVHPSILILFSSPLFHLFLHHFPSFSSGFLSILYCIDSDFIGCFLSPFGSRSPIQFRPHLDSTLRFPHYFYPAIPYPYRWIHYLYFLSSHHPAWSFTLPFALAGAHAWYVFTQ